MGGFKAQKSYIGALTWASLPGQAPADPSGQPQGQTPPQGKDQLLLFSGSSDGCVRVHAQSVEALSAAQVQSRGAQLQGDLMQLGKTLHPADLLGVTCLAVKRATSSQTGMAAQSDVQTHHLTNILARWQTDLKWVHTVMPALLIESRRLTK